MFALLPSLASHKLASLSPSVAVVREPAHFDEEIVPFKGILNWLDLSIFNGVSQKLSGRKKEKTVRRLTKCPDHRDGCSKSHVVDSAGLTSLQEACLSPCRGRYGTRFAVSPGLGRVQYERSVCLLLIRWWAVSQT